MKRISFISFTLICFTIFYSCTSSNEKTSLPKASLENTRWVLRSLNDKKVFTPESGKEAYITFSKKDLQASGNAGCNSFFTSYSVTSNRIKMGPVARTEMFCEQQMETENNFVKALEAAERFKIKGDKLYLYDSIKQIASFEVVYLN